MPRAARKGRAHKSCARVATRTNLVRGMTEKDGTDDTDGADDAPCTWRRAPLALSLRMQDLYSRGWNATYDSRRQYDVPLEQVQQNAAILEAAFADVAASRFAGGGRAALSCAIA